METTTENIVLNCDLLIITPYREQIEFQAAKAQMELGPNQWDTLRTDLETIEDNISSWLWNEFEIEFLPEDHSADGELKGVAHFNAYCFSHSVVNEFIDQGPRSSEEMKGQALQNVSSLGRRLLRLPNNFERPVQLVFSNPCQMLEHGNYSKYRDFKCYCATRGINKEDIEFFLSQL